MTEVFILQNQAKLFLGKQNQWLDGRELASLYKTEHKDEAVNQVFEASSKDYTQRIKILSCPVNEKGLPIIDTELMPEPIPKQVRDLFDVESANSDASQTVGSLE